MNISKDQEFTKSIRSFQLLINRLLQSINTFELNLDSEAYVSHCLMMLNQILLNEEIMSYREIKEVFYTQYATNTIFSLISKEYHSIGGVIQIRKFAYDILIKLMEIDIFAARKSFRIWTHSNNNKNKFFGRIIRLMD